MRGQTLSSYFYWELCLGLKALEGPEADRGAGNLKCGLVCCHGNIFSSEFKYLKVTQQKLSLQKYKQICFSHGSKNPENC